MSPGTPAPVPLPPDTLRLSRLAQDIQGALKRSFPRRIWVIGEISELERSLTKTHWFFRLCETEIDSGQRYQLGAVLWQGDHRRLFGPGGTLVGVVEPRDGIEVRALVEIDFWPPRGDLRLVVREIDAAWTLGKIALERQQLIDRLGREGVLALQQRLALPECPLRIGLISSFESAAYNDFVKEITGCGVAFRVLFFDARMQGEDTVRTVLRGIEVLASHGVEAIAVVRGGGSIADLAWFDREELVRAIAGCPIPVLTGIGHEIDVSVADLAAHLRFKTPTAVAAFLAERGREALRELADSRERLLQIAAQPEKAASLLAETADDLARRTIERVVGEQGGLARLGQAVRLLAPRVIAVEDSALGLARRSFAAIAGRRTASAAGDLRVLATRMTSPVWLLAIDRVRDALGAAEARVRAVEPERVLRRGYALLRRPDGTIVKDKAGVNPGDRVDAVLRDGRISTLVLGDEPAPDQEKTNGKAQVRRRRRGDDHRQLEIW